MDGHKARLVDEVRELRAAKRQLEEEVEAAGAAARGHGASLRARQDDLRLTLARARRYAQADTRALVGSVLYCYSFCDCSFVFSLLLFLLLLCVIVCV